MRSMWCGILFHKASAPRQLLHALLYSLHNPQGCGECRFCMEQNICPCSRAHAPYLHLTAMDSGNVAGPLERLRLCTQREELK